MFDERFFDSAGVRLHYIDWGGEGLPIVLLGGMGATAHLFRGLAPRLAEHGRVAALTRRGHGRSDRPDSGYEIDTLVDDIARFLDHLNLERVVLIGHSFAGIEIPRFAVRYPDRVAAVVYLDALHVFLEPLLNDADNPAIAALNFIPEPQHLETIDTWKAWHRRSRPDIDAVWCEAVEADRLEDLTLIDDKPVLDGHGGVVGRKLKEGLGEHVNPEYGAVSAPALAIVPGGDTNPFLPRDADEDLVRAANAYYVDVFRPRVERRTALFKTAVRSAQIIELDTSNHTIFVAKEDETLVAILEFLRTIAD